MSKDTSAALVRATQPDPTLPHDLVGVAVRPLTRQHRHLRKVEDRIFREDHLV